MNSTSFVEHQIENVVGDKAMRVVKGVGKLAAKQGGETMADNYRLLGKRSLILLGVTLGAVQLVTSTVGLAMLHKAEEKRIERVVRRIMEEERRRQEGVA